MGIIQRLEKKEGFSNNDLLIAEYMLDNPFRILKMSTREVGHASLTNASSVTRLCQKVNHGLGFNAFKIQLSSELSQRVLYFDQETSSLDAQDDIKSIVNKIKTLEEDAINYATQKINYQQLAMVAALLNEKRIVDIYASGINAYSASEFAYLTNRLAIKTYTFEDNAMQFSQAMNADQKHCAILISHWGENKRLIKIATLLKKKEITTIAITGSTTSTLSKIVDHTLLIKTGNRFSDLGPIVFTTSIKYILNIIFGILFTLNYEKNLDHISSFEESGKGLFD